MKPNFTSQIIAVFSVIFLSQGYVFSQQIESISLADDRVRHELFFDGKEQAVEVCDLKKGETYRVWAVQTNMCQPVAQVVGGDPAAATFDFVADSDCMDMIYTKNEDCKGATFLSFSCVSLKQDSSMSQKLAALFVTDGYTAESLISDIFIGGGCFDIENVQPIGPDAGRGRFGAGDASIIIEDGVILESGNILNALGPNNSNSAGNNIGGGSDPDLALLATAGVFDAVGIEFDFTPTIDAMSFDFVFASEEYCEYVNSSFNDVFGFFISGPGITGPFSGGGDNIATLPNGTPVAINNVNHLSNTGFFVPNQDNCGGFFNQPDIQFDGYTVPLTAEVILQACETYHIRLVVGDAGDGIFDSAVFLEANSFSAGNAITGEATSLTTGTNQIYEDCNDGYLLFYRASGDPSVPLIYDLELSAFSTATPGVDYDALPTQIVMGPFETFVQIPINVFADGIPEGVETIILTMENACSCSDEEIIIEILDSEPIVVDLEPQDVCAGEPILLEIAPTGGLGVYEIEWSTGETNVPMIFASPPLFPSYSVTVTDECGGLGSTSTLVTVYDLPSAFITGDNDAFLCSDDPTSSVPLTVTFSGTPPWTFVYTIDGSPQPPITTSVNPYIIDATQPGAYQLVNVVSAAGNCTGTASGLAIVNTLEMTVDLQPQPSTCIIGGSLLAGPGGGIPPYAYEWSETGPEFSPVSPFVIDIPGGTYSVTVTDVNGCTGIDEAIVEEIEPLEATYEVTSADCLSGSAGSIEIDAMSGSNPINYNWSDGLPNAPSQTDLETGTYYVTIFDNIGCTIIDSMIIENDADPPAADADTPDILNCTNMTTGVTGDGSSTGTDISYEWSGPGIVSGADEIDATVNLPGTYILVVTDNSNGCTSTASTEVDSETTPPVAVADGDELSCTSDEVDISGTGSSTGGDFEYLWSGPGIVSGGTTLNPTVDAAGTYTLVVTNTVNGCTEDATAIVTQDNSIPVAIIDDPVSLDCNINSLTLDGGSSSSGPGITYQWFNNGTSMPGETSTTLDVSTPGSYEIVVFDGSNGCDANYSVEVLEDLAGPPVTAAADGQFTCTQDIVGLTVNVPGSPADFTYVWSTDDGSFIGGTTSQNATAGTPGDYDVIVTSSLNGCTGTATVTVTQDASIPTAVIEPTDDLNCLATELQLDGSGSSQGPSLTFTWTTVGGTFVAGQNTLTPTINAAGTYILSISDDSNGCATDAQIIVVQDAVLPDAVIMPAPMLNCDVTSLVFDASVTNFPVSDLDILWETTNGVITGPTNILNAETSAPGTYTLTVTNINTGCTDEVEVIVTQDDTEPVPIISNPDALTCTNNTVTLDASLSTAGMTIEYEWTTATGNIVTGGNTLTPVVDQDGEYILTITNTANGCDAFSSVIVEQNANVPEAEAGPQDDLTCQTGQLTLNGSGSLGPEYEYEWNGPGILNNGNTFNPLINAPGVYQLVVTNTTNQCSATDNVIVGEDYLAPNAEAGLGGQLSCSVTSMALDGAGSSTTDVTYLWTSPDGNILSGETSLTPQINAPGTYVIEVTNTLNGCTSTDEVLIEEDDDLPGVDIALAPPITCQILELTLDGTGTQTGADFEYVWGTSAGGNIVSGASTLTPLVNAPGTYSLTVTNTATNCTNIGSVTVGEDAAPPAVEAGQTTELTCVETSTDLNGGGSATGSGISYLWTTADGNIVSGETTLSPTIDDPGTYTLLVTDANNGCTNTDEVTITESSDVPIADAVAFGQLTCVSEQVIINGSGGSTGINFSYQWTTTDGNIVSGADEVVATVDQPGDYVLVVTNNLNSCTATDEVPVLQNIIPPTVEAGNPTDLTCDSETATLDGAGSATGTDYEYLWTSLDGNIVSGGTTLTPIVDQVGTYVLTVTNGQNGCTAFDEVLVNLDQSFPDAAIAPPAMLTCEITSISLSGTASQGADYEFVWSSTDGNIVSGDETLLPVIDEPGTYVLFVTNNLNGCTNEAEVTVGENTVSPQANAGIDFIMDCDGDFPTLSGLSSTGNGALSYTWTTANGIIDAGANTAEPTVAQSGDYTLTIVDLSNGCTDTDEVMVSTTGPSADPETLQPKCFGGLGAIVIANVSGGVTPYLYSIDGGSTFSDEAIYTDLGPGTYEVVVQDVGGCEHTESISIIEPDLFNIEIEDFAYLEHGEEYQINTQVNVPVDEISQITWNPAYDLSCSDCLNPIATPQLSTVYHLHVVTENGCEDEATILLEVNKEDGVYIPNAFSPNADGANDIFMVFTDKESVAKVKSLLVFSRWGETVFEHFNFPPDDPAYGWDGYHRGSLLNPAVFVWMAEIEFEDGRVELMQGDVSILR